MSQDKPVLRGKWVPWEATSEMIQAMEDRQIEGASYIAENSIQYALWKEVWKAALAAAPHNDHEPPQENTEERSGRAPSGTASGPASGSPDGGKK